MISNKIEDGKEVPIEKLREIYEDYSLTHPEMLRKVRDWLRDLHKADYTIGVCRTILRQSGLSLRKRGTQKIFPVTFTLEGKPVKKVTMKKHKRYENMAEIMSSTTI